MKKTIYIILLAILSTSFIHAQQVEWVKGMGGVGAEQGISNAVDSAGNVYSTGFFEGTADFDPGMNTHNLVSKGGKDIFIQKSDTEGNFLWAKSMGGSQLDIGRKIAVDAIGNVYTTGVFSERVDFDPNSDTSYLGAMMDNSIFIQKLDPSGNLIWAKSMGGIYQNAGYAIDVDKAGNVYTTGYFEGTVDFDPNAGVNNLTTKGRKDIFIQKLDSAGNLIWAKRIGGPFWEHVHSLTVDSAQNILITGRFQDMVDFDPNTGTNFLLSNGLDDIFILKLTKSGNFVWAKSMGGGGLDYGISTKLDNKGNVYTSGYFRGTIDLDPNSGIQNFTSQGFTDRFIQKLDSNGNLVWAKTIGSPNTDATSWLDVDTSGNVYIVGDFFVTTDFDPNSGVSNLTPIGPSTSFIQKLDTHGNLVWAKGLGGTYPRGVVVTSSNQLYIISSFEAMTDFDLRSGMLSLSPVGQLDVLVMKISQDENVAIEAPQISPFSIYPNPSSGLFYIDLPADARQAEVQVVDHLGRNISQHIVTSSQRELNLSHISPGVYHLQLVLSTGEKYFQKVIRK